jgi:shikimate kinase
MVKACASNWMQGGCYKGSGFCFFALFSIKFVEGFPDMRIYLIGFMGCGKSSLGKRLARRLGYAFYDTDQEIERETGKKIGELFREEGEAAFRERERQMLRMTADLERVVVATGGGTPCFFDNMDFIRAHGVSVYLRMSVTSLVHRLENARTKRPLLQDFQGEALFTEISERLADREQWYLKAHCVIKGETAKPNHIVSLVFGSDGGE